MMKLEGQEEFDMSLRAIKCRTASYAVHIHYSIKDSEQLSVASKHALREIKNGIKVRGSLRYLQVFCHSGAVGIYPVFAGGDLLCRELLPESILLSLARLDVWVSAGVQYLVLQEKSGGFMQNRYGDLLGKMPQVTKCPLHWKFHRFVEYWGRQELCILPWSGGLEDRKQDVLITGWEQSLVLQYCSTRKSYLAVSNEYWKHCIATGLKKYPQLFYCWNHIWFYGGYSPGSSASTEKFGSFPYPHESFKSSAHDSFNLDLSIQ